MAKKKKGKKCQDDTNQQQSSTTTPKVTEVSKGANQNAPDKNEDSLTAEPVVDLTVKQEKGDIKPSTRAQDIVSKTAESSKKSGVRDGRLLGRIKEYLSGLSNKNFVSIPLMAEHLQNKYPEYRRKKKGPFVQYVDRAYFSMEKDKSTKVKDEMGGEISSDSCDEDEEDLVEYADTNSMNSMMSNLYKNSPSHSSDGKRRRDGSPGRDTKRPKIVNDASKPEKVMYPSPNALNRNLNSTGLVGPRRSADDKYFIDRNGNNSDTSKSGSNIGSSREANIQEFLSSLPSRTSYSAYVNSKQDPRLRSGTLYRVYKSGDMDGMLNHSGITDDNEGVTADPPSSPGVRVDDDGVRETDKHVKASVDEIESQTKGEKVKKGKKKKDGSRRKQNDDDTDDSKVDKAPSVQKSTITFADVGGNDTVLTDICKLLVHMRHPEVYEQLGITPPRGFLLHGPPGCGKTLLANAVAGELDLPLIKIAATEIVSGVSGDSEQKVRQLFDTAVQSAPCVVFIDEIDSITPKRETASKDMERRIVAQLLACMDDLSASNSAHVLVIGATNRPDSLDPALRRAGRFDREICLGIPDETARMKILQVLCRPLRLTESFDFGYLARNTPGYVGADLMALSREAAMVAVNRVFQDLQLRASKTQTTDQNIAIETSISDDISSSKMDTSNSDCTGAARSSVPNLSDSSTEVNKEYVSGSSNVKTISEKEASLMQAETSVDEEDINVKEAIAIEVQEEVIVAKEETVNSDYVTGSHDNEEITNNPCDSASSGTYVQSLVKSCDTEGNEVIDTSVDTTTKCDGESADTLNQARTDEHTLHDQQQEISDPCLIDNTVVPESESSLSVMQNTVQRERAAVKDDLFSVLSWLKDQPPLTQDQLRDLYISLDDFKEALQFVQPSAKREGFATIPDVSWDDIGALQDVREELQLAVLAPVRHAEEFKSLGLNRAQGVLLAGPPGCGKTLLAKAVANESGINFISVKGPELLNMYVGESEKAVRTVFQRGRNSSPCVIFFDELDALCPRRSGSAEGGSSARVVNQLLTEMDGLEERKQVFIMAATNRPDIIDPAILRPGRLDKILYVGLPTKSDRCDILTCITKNGTKPSLADNVELGVLAADSRCDGYTGADLAALVREASVIALKEAILNKERQPTASIIVTKNHFDIAFSKIKPSVSGKDQEKYRSMREKLIQPDTAT